jgi:mono/diheme cytochrome c family protein
MRRLLPIAALLGAVAASGCNDGESGDLTQDEIFHRMQKQQKYRPYQHNPFYADGRAMRVPPAGTLSRQDYQRGERFGPGGLLADGTFVESLPVPVDMDLLRLGRKQYDITCAACHGLVGDGQSMVAVNMALAAPVSFHSDKLRTKPDGYIYEVISHGYGVMPGFAWRFSPEERWAVVAYIRVLQYSQNVPLAEVPAEIRATLRGGSQ